MLGDLLRETAAREPDAVAFVDGDRRLTYAEWDWLSDRAAYSLGAEGIRPGDVVALHLRPSFAYPIAYLGAAKLGCVSVGINPRWGEREIDHVLDHSLARALVTDRPMAPEPLLFTPDRLNRPGGEPPRPDLSPDDPVAIVYTSGTTGLPKGAVFCSRALEAVRRIEAALEPDPYPRTIAATPLAHMGFMTKIGSHIDRRMTTVLMSDRWTAPAALDLVERERITLLGGVPTQMALMLLDPAFARTDLSSLREVLIGGAPASPELVRTIREGFRVPVLVRYSCTELGLATGTRPGDPDEVVASTVGRPLPEVDLAVRDPGDDGVGEIRVRSPAMFSGYWRDPEPPLDEHGFFATGDLGRIGPDGNLRLAGRSKEMYIRGGYNVYPVEVEAVLREHPKVEMAAVVAIPDPVLGERGKAFVVPRDPAAPPTLDELRAFAAARIADYKAPDELEIREALPLNAMFKVDKGALAGEP